MIDDFIIVPEVENIDLNGRIMQLSKRLSSKGKQPPRRASS